MKKSLIFLLLTTFGGQLFGQDEGESAGGFGGMGYFQPGIAFRLPNDLGTELNTFLREEEDYKQTSLMLGGGGFLKLKGNLIIAGNGFAMLYPAVEGDDSNVKIAGGGGGFNAGWVVRNDGTWFGFPHLGFGAFGYNINVENFGSLVNQGKFYIPPGGNLDINSEVIYLDVGVNLLRRLLAGAGGGPAIGISAGFMQAVYSTPWETSEGANLDNMSDPEFSNFYLKISIGGGGFN